MKTLQTSGIAPDLTRRDLAAGYLDCLRKQLLCRTVDSSTQHALKVMLSTGWPPSRAADVVGIPASLAQKIAGRQRAAWVHKTKAENFYHKACFTE